MREKVFSSLLAVLCTAVVRRVFRAFVRVVSQWSFVYLAARRTIDCEQNIVSIVVQPLPTGYSVHGGGPPCIPRICSCG